MTLNGNKTTIGAVSMLAVYILGLAGVHVTETEIAGYLAGAFTFAGLIHKLFKLFQNERNKMEPNLNQAMAGAPGGIPGGIQGPEAGPEAATTAKKSFTVDQNEDGTFTVTDNTVGAEGQPGAPQNFQGLDELMGFLGESFAPETPGTVEQEGAGPVEQALPAPAGAEKRPNVLSKFFSPR